VIGLEFEEGRLNKRVNGLTPLKRVSGQSFDHTVYFVKAFERVKGLEPQTT